MALVARVNRDHSLNTVWHAFTRAKSSTSVGRDILMARYYDSARGQFVTQDPVFWEIGVSPDGRRVLTNPQQANSYSYAGDNPISNKDPDGRFWWKEFYTDWNGYSGWSGLAMKGGEVFGGRFAAQDAISANRLNIANSSAQTGVSPQIYQSIMYEETAHQFPPGEMMIENAAPGLTTYGIGAMQVSPQTSGRSKSSLLNDRTNVSASGLILSDIQARSGFRLM
jgi:RHS repeat-associated protein